MDYSPASLANRPFFLCSRHDPWLVRRAVSSITAEKPEPPLPTLNLMVKKCTPLQTFSRKPEIAGWVFQPRKKWDLGEFLFERTFPCRFFSSFLLSWASHTKTKNEPNLDILTHGTLSRYLFFIGGFTSEKRFLARPQVIDRFLLC